MGLLDTIGATIDGLRGYCDTTSTLVNMITVLGFLLVLICDVQISLWLYKAFRLYFINQRWNRTDFRKKYGQWAVVTGATDGIGLAMAKELARRGMSIVAVGRDPERLAKTKEALSRERNAGEIVTVQADFFNFGLDDYKRVCSLIDPDNRDIGILVNNAGTALPNFAKFHQRDIRDLVDMSNVNSLAAVHFTKMILSGMLRRRRGLLLNVASGIGAVPLPYIGLYYPSKAFAQAMSEILRQEYGSEPIDIVTLNPGVVYTKLVANVTDLRHENPICATPELFARSSLNALATPYPVYNGTFGHEASVGLINWISPLGMGPIILRILMRLFARAEATELLRVSDETSNKKQEEKAHAS